ncbi:RHS repeat-associated core domain-containing protein, partial [Sulfurimonas sp.]
AREFESDDLYYYRARYYDPTIQRFLSKDPIEFLSGDYNFYRYVRNNPSNRTDALGLMGQAIAITAETTAEGCTLGPWGCVGGFIIGVGLSLATVYAGKKMVDAMQNSALDGIGSSSGTDTILQDDTGNITWTADNDGTTKPTTGAVGNIKTEVKVKADSQVKRCKKNQKDSRKIKGDCGECLVEKCYESKGYTSLGVGGRAVDLKDDDTIAGLANGRGNGIDHVFTNGNETVFVETKTGSAGLNAGQQEGGSKYIEKMIKKMGIDGEGFTNARKEPGYEELYEKVKNANRTSNKKYHTCHVETNEDEGEDGCYGSDSNGKINGNCGPGTKCQGSVSCYDWSAGTTAQVMKPENYVGGC